MIAALAAVAMIAVLSYRALAARAEAADAVNHTNEVQDHLHRFLSDMKDAETGQRGYLLTGMEHYLDPYHLALGGIAIELSTLRRLLAGNPMQERRIETIAPLVDAKLAEIAETIRLERNGDVRGALAVVQSDRGRAAMDRIRDVVETMLAAEQTLLNQRTAEWQATVEWSSYVMFGGVGVIIAMIILIGVLASRSFRAVEDDAWSRRVQLALSAQLQGEHDLSMIGERALRVLTDHLHARVGALYVRELGGQLRRVAGHALPTTAPETLQIGDGLTGQAAMQDHPVHLRDVPAGHLEVASAVGKSAPRELVIAPAAADGAVQAVTELGFLHRLDRTELGAIERLSESIALAVRTARDRQRLVDLLEEVQRQAEELQTQQEELRVSNEELAHRNVQHEILSQSLEQQRDELIRTGAELRRSSEYKSQFLANMSHELRTPLNSTLILAKLLADNRDGNLNSEQIKFAQTIYAAGNDLLTLINDILDLSKIEAGMLDVRSTPIAIARLADDLGRAFQPIAHHKQLAFDVRVEPSAPDSIDSDPTRLQQILRNLLSNAVKFTEVGGVSLVISGAGDTIAFAVRDTGIGIASAQHEAIFEPFRQVDGAGTRKFGGTGLGLSISRDLAHLLGGDLQLTSTPGHGSTFTLTLPARAQSAMVVPRRRTLPQALAVPELPGAARGTPPALPAASAGAPFEDDRDRARGAPRCLLVIEDDTAFARVIYDLAHELEFLCVIATTAEDGLTLTRQLLPSAVVLDVGLPDRSGLAVLDALKRDPATRHIPVHVMSAVDYARGALAMGAAGYALKPIDRERLIEALRHLEAKFTQKLRRVLVVEDDAVARETTARLLAGDDIEVITAASAGDALDLLRAGTFDCMVLDLALPDRSGLEVLDEMARGEHYAFPPVIVYSGRSLSQDEVHELERFSSAIVIKGARSPERLLDEVTLFLHQVESRLPADRRRMLREVRSRDAAFEGRRILVVEDDVRSVFALSNVLEPKGATIEIARNGREAIEQLRTRPDIDLVLMDIMMPEMDGLEATRKLREDPRFARLPIIALTAKARADDRDKCLAAGANDYIAKPLDVDKLVSLVRVWIGS